MKLVCEARTGGGPVGIMTIASAKKWNGGGDYFQIIRENDNRPLQFFNIKGRCSGFLFHQVDDGDYLVYSDQRNILIICEGYSPEGSLSTKDALPEYEPYILRGDFLPVTPFGRWVAIFDSVYPGKLISQNHPGSQSIGFSSEEEDDEFQPTAPNAILVDVEPGLWQALPLHREDDQFAYDGALFRHVSR